MSEVFQPLVAEFRAYTGDFIKGVNAAAKAAEDMGAKIKAASDAAARAQIAAGEAALRAADMQKRAADTAARYAAGEISDYQSVADAAERASLAQGRASLAASSAQDKSAAATAAAADSHKSSLEKVGGAFATFGKYAAAGTAAVAVGSIAMAASFQKQTSVLQTAAGETTSGLKTMRTGILDIASSTGTSWQNLSTGAYTLEKAGYRGADALKVLKAAAQGASEENADLGTTTNAMTSVMASYHLGASQAVPVMNALKTAAGESKTTMEGYAASLSTVLPVASAAGLKFDQVAGAVATLTQHGTSADQATQDLANTIRNLQAPNRVASNEMAQFGLSANDVASKLGQRGLTGTVDLLTKTIASKMGPSGLVVLNSFNQSKAAAADAKTMLAQLPAAAQSIAQAYANGSLSVGDYREALKTLPAPMGSLLQQWKATEDRSKGFNAMLKGGDPAAKTFADALKKMTGGAVGMNTALMLGGANMASFKKHVAAVGKSLNDQGKDVEGWSQTQQLFTTRLNMAKQTAEKFAITLGTALLPVATRLVNALMGGVNWLQHHATAAKALAAVLGTILAAAITAYGIEKLAALKESLTGAAETMGKLGGKLADGAKAAASFGGKLLDGAQAVASFTVDLGKDIAAGARWVAEKIAQYAAAAAAAIASAAATAAAWIAANAAMLLASGGIALALGLIIVGVYELVKHWHAVWGAIKTATEAVWRFLKAAFHDGLRFIENLWSTVWGAIKSAFETVLHDVEAAVRFYVDTWEKIFSAAWNAISTVFTDVWHGIKDVVNTALEWVKSFITTEINGVETVWSAVWKAITTVVSDFWNGLKVIVGDIVSLGLHVVRDEIHALQTVWNDVWGGLSKVVGDAWSAVKPIVDTIARAIGALASTVKTLISDLGKVTSAPGKLLNKIGLNSGGVVPGSGDSDTVPAMLTPGEYVITKQVAQTLGYNYLDALNSGSLRAYATGGRVTRHDLPKSAGSLSAAARAPVKQYAGVTVQVAAVRTTKQSLIHQQAIAYGQSLHRGRYTSDATYAGEVSKRTGSHLSELERKAMIPLQRNLSTLGKALAKDKTAERHGTLTDQQLDGLKRQLELDEKLARVFELNTRGTSAHTEAVNKLSKVTADLKATMALATAKAAAVGTDAGTVLGNAEAASSGKAGTAHHGFTLNNNAYATLLGERGSTAAEKQQLAVQQKIAATGKVGNTLLKIGENLGLSLLGLTKVGQKTSEKARKTGESALKTGTERLKVGHDAYGVSKNHLAVGMNTHTTIKHHVGVSEGHRSDQQTQHKEIMGAHKDMLASQKELRAMLAAVVKALGSESAILSVDGDKIAGVISRKQLAKLKAR